MSLRAYRFQLKPMSFRARLDAQREVRIVKASRDWKRKNFHRPLSTMIFLNSYHQTNGR